MTEKDIKQVNELLDALVKNALNDERNRCAKIVNWMASGPKDWQEAIRMVESGERK